MVLSKSEVHQVLEQISEPEFRLQATLLYGAGLCLLDCLHRRVKDVDFVRRQITVRETKGNEARVTMLPEQLIPILHERLRPVKQLFEASYDIRTVQELLGHKDIKTTQIYPHLLSRGPSAVRSPLGV